MPEYQLRDLFHTVPWLAVWNTFCHVPYLEWLIAHERLPRFHYPSFASALPHGMKIATLFVVANTPVLISSVTIPPELFSLLIPQKVLSTFQSLSTPILYPHITDSVEGKWIDHSVNWWTSGFLPAIGYLMLARQRMCNSTQSFDTSGGDWLTLGRSSAGPLANLNAIRGVEHDIGFISFPFVEELVVCVFFLIHTQQTYTWPLEILRIKLQETLSTNLQKCLQ